MTSDISSGAERGASPISTKDASVIARQKGVFTEPPVVTPTRKTPDGPLLGNGDLGVAISGVIERRRFYGLDEHASNTITDIAAERSPERHRFWLAKNDFWKSKAGYPNSHPCSIGGIDVSIPALINGDYQVEQILETAEVVHTLTTKHEAEDPTPFTREGAVIKIRSWVPATENLVIIELTVEGDIPDDDPFARNNLVGVDVNLWATTGNEAETATGNLADGYWATRTIGTTPESIALDQTSCEWTSEAAVAMRLFNHREPGLSWFRMDGWAADRFVISPTHTTTIVASIVTSEESETPLELAKQCVADMTQERIEELRTAHRKWWCDFWSKSFVDIGDPVIERYYYGSNYLMASCSRNVQFAPGLYGNWITADGPAWQGDYHLNYNHEAPWWGVCSSNHVELADPYDSPILDNLPHAIANAKNYLNLRGAYCDVGVGPKGLQVCGIAEVNGTDNESDRFLGQKSNAVFCTSNMFMRFYHTYDLDYARRVYPFLIEVASFWENFLTWEESSAVSGRYVIANDAMGERGGGEGDKNNCLSLGLVRMFFKGMLEVSTTLDSDAERREKWQHILDHLSDFPTVEKDGQLYFRGAEEGPASNELSTGRVAITGLVWPSCLFGLNSDPELLRTLQNEVRHWPDWEWINHNNGFTQVFPAAARVGHDPHDILAKMHQQIDIAGYPNLMIFGGGGGIENCSGVPATINEMLLQTHEGVTQVFPVWPSERNARFGRLRTPGAFLVSSELRDGEVQGIIIESEKGRDCVLRNPWPGRELQLQRSDGTAELLDGDRICFSTTNGESICICPA
jgi:hypothetical protein